MISFPRLQQLLRLKPEKRPTAAAIARHPWLVRSLDVLRIICFFLTQMFGFFYGVSIQLAKSHDSTSVLQCGWDLGDSRSWGSCRSSDFHDSEAQNMFFFVFFSKSIFLPIEGSVIWRLPWKQHLWGGCFFWLRTKLLKFICFSELFFKHVYGSFTELWIKAVARQLEDSSFFNLQDATARSTWCWFAMSRMPSVIPSTAFSVPWRLRGKDPHRRHRFFRFFFDSVRWPGQAQCRGPLTEQVGLDKTARASH